MLRSMTGFGRATYDDENRGFIVEMRSVNHKYLDLNIRMPKNLACLEDRMRKLIQDNISRGKLDIFITQNNYKSGDTVAVLNEGLCDSYVDCLKAIKDRYQLRDEFSLQLISKFPDVISVVQKEEDVEAIWEALSKPLADALKMLAKMRENEGLKLQENINQRCNTIKSMVDEIEARSPIIIENYRKKLNDKLEELLGDSGIDQNRIAMEVALFVDKSSIDEEIVRLNSHIIQMMETLNLNEPTGRKLDFIVQEMNRETNTIASKTNDIEITKIVLNIKNEIEKIREQIQNIE